jgi:acetyl-CoA synthetase
MMEFPAHQYNIGYLCTTWQCHQAKGHHVALRWIDAQGKRADYTFSDLDHLSNAFANVLQQLGSVPGDLLFTLLPKMPEQFYIFLGTLKAQLICGTLFSSFGPEALEYRLKDAQTKLVVTKRSLVKKILSVRDRLPDLAYILVVDETGHTPEQGIYSLPQLLSEASSDYETPLTQPDQPSVLHYTSGSTGQPKGVLHCHRSVLMQQSTSKEIVGLQEEDVYWCTADQGWVTGTSYGIIGPWSLGITQIHYGGGYDAEVWCSILRTEKVSVWYTAPTALRMLMREENQRLFTDDEFPSLKRIYSVGEPLNPEVIRWGRTTLRREIYDTWFQTETGAIMIANRPGLAVRDGSMGTPAAGITAALLDQKGDCVTEGQQGELCIQLPWPSMFVSYLKNDASYQQKFLNGFYHTGDMAWRDAQGYYWFVGRSDDVINTAGHLISPFEVESTLLELEEVAESGVVGIPDELLHEKVVAFIQLSPGYNPSAALEIKIRLHVANQLSAIATPRNIVFCSSLPKNKSGKILRRLLRTQESSAPGEILIINSDIVDNK